MAEQDSHEMELPIDSVGVRLRRAREKAGLSRADIAARTKIAERHLEAIEEGRLSDLASRTYAVGFSRTYARTVGLDEQEIAQAVREELVTTEQQWEPTAQTFEPGDPARVPPSRFAWIAGLGALAVIVLVLIYWRGFFDPAVSLPDFQSPEEEATEQPRADASRAAPSARGPVVFTALEPNIWVKFYDAQGVQLMQKQLAEGESYTVPADAEGPQLWTARPDALAITIGGQRVAMLSDEPVTMKDIPVTAAALLARNEPAQEDASATESGAAASPAARLPAPAVTTPVRALAPAPRQTAPAAAATRTAPAPTRTPAPQPTVRQSAPAVVATPTAAATVPQAAVQPASAPAGAEASTVSD